MDVPQMFKEVLGLSIFIFALVAQLKRFGVKGLWLEGASYGGGLVFGGLYRYFVYTPATSADWFFLVIFGMIGGFVATGAYKGLESATGGAEMRLQQREINKFNAKLAAQKAVEAKFDAANSSPFSDEK